MYCYLLSHILFVRMVCDDAIVADTQVPKDAVATFFGCIEDDILLDCIVAIHSGIHRDDARVEASSAFEYGMSLLLVVVPIGKAMVVEAASTVAEEADSKLVAIAEVVPVVFTLVDEPATTFVLHVRVVVEWVDIAKAVACGTKVDAYMHAADAHVCQGVVEAFYKYADAARLSVARDIGVGDVAVGRAAVCSVLDVYADCCVFDGRLPNGRLASAVDGDAFCYASSINDTAFQVVVAARHRDIVGGVFASETYHGLFAGPVFCGSYNGEVRKFECDAFLRVGRCEDGLADDIDAVGKENGAVRVRVDDALNVVADVFTCLRFYVIGDDDVASPGVHLGEQHYGQCQEQGDEC